MRESRTYGSVRGACHETHVPTATGAASSFPLLISLQLRQALGPRGQPLSAIARPQRNRAGERRPPRRAMGRQLSARQYQGRM